MDEDDNDADIGEVVAVAMAMAVEEDGHEEDSRQFSVQVTPK